MLCVWLRLGDCSPESADQFYSLQKDTPFDLTRLYVSLWNDLMLWEICEFTCLATCCCHTHVDSTYPPTQVMYMCFSFELHSFDADTTLCFRHTLQTTSPREQVQIFLVYVGDKFQSLPDWLLHLKHLPSSFVACFYLDQPAPVQSCNWQLTIGTRKWLHWFMML